MKKLKIYEIKNKAREYLGKTKRALGTAMVGAALGAVLFIGVPNAKNYSGEGQYIQRTKISNAIAMPETEHRRLPCSYYDNVPPASAAESLEGIIASTGQVTGVPVFEYQGNQLSKTYFGTGTLLKGGYILSAQHVTHVDELIMEIIPGVFGPVQAEWKSQENTIKIGGVNGVGAVYSLEEVVGNKQLDYSILRIKNCSPEIKKQGVLLGDSSKLKVGNIVYICGNGGNEGLDVRSGIISKLEIDVGDGWGLRFGFSPLIIGGDSGGAAYTSRNSALEYVALMQLRSGIFNYGVGITAILNHLRGARPDVYGDVTQK